MDIKGEKGKLLLFPVVIVFLSFLLRAYRIFDIPPGFSLDEAANALDILSILDSKALHIFFWINSGREPLFIYLQALSVYFLGLQASSLRLVSVFVGVLTVASAYRLAKDMFPARGGFPQHIAVPSLVAFLLSFSFWHLNLSRFGLRAISLPLLATLTFIFFWRFYTRRNALYALLAGLFLGLTIYTYPASRFVPLVILLFLGTQALLGWRRGSGLLRSTLLLFLSFSVIVAPMAYYAISHPDIFWYRADEVDVLSGGAFALIQNLGRVGAMFIWRGDESHRQNLDAQPVFDPPLAFLFVLGIGLAVAVLSGKDRASKAAFLKEPLAFSLIWLIVMLTPTILSKPSPHFLRAIGILPVVYFFPAVVMALAWQWVGGQKGWVRQRAAAGLILILALSFGLKTVGDYFLVWAPSPHTYYVTDSNTIELAAYVKKRSEDTRIYLDNFLMNNFTLRLYLRDMRLDYFDPSKGFAAPWGKVEYILLPQNQGQSVFRRLLRPSVKPETVYDTKGNPLFVSYAISGTAGLDPGIFAPYYQDQQQFPSLWTSFNGELVPRRFALLDENVKVIDPPALLPGKPLRVVTQWQCLNPRGDYSLSLKLTDKKGRVWGQSDGLPGGTLLTSNCQTRESDPYFYDYRELMLRADSPPGVYQLSLSVYERQTLRTLPLFSHLREKARGETYTLASVRVARPSAEAIRAITPRQRIDQAVIPGLRLIGHSIEPPQSRGGDAVDIHLYWYTERTPTEDFNIVLQTLDSGGVTNQIVEPPVDGQFPMRQWRPGDAIHDVHRIILPASVRAGPLRVFASVVGTSHDPAPLVSLGRIRIADRPRRFDTPGIPYATDIDFGDTIRLLGFGPPTPGLLSEKKDPLGRFRPGESLTFVLFWRSLKETATSYSVFVQILNEQGILAAQHDGIPEQGDLPTTSWLKGEVIQDVHKVELSPDLAPGLYQVIVGLYDASTGKRLPTRGGDFALLGEIEVR